ncbi:MAG: hypothetical protein A2Z34_11585 [Planctomycetes bacterium RBG_16_59_8]|nr:MAG: hypothetical protein A2Z34_11585 [Planctomycetes bacterium RBG_16_59_8]
MKRLLDGALLGAGFVAVVAVAFAIAWAGDVFTVDKDGIPKFAVSDAGKITVGATESYVNLVIQNNSGAATNKVDITADVLTVERIRLESVNVSADITAAGAGGLDTGGEDSNMWYYVWVIANDSGTSVNGLLTEAGTASEFAPVMPAGFAKKRRVGAVRNNGSGNFLQFVQEGNFCNYLAGAGGGNRILSAGTATGWTTISATSFMPPTSRRGLFRLSGSVKHGTVNTVFNITLGQSPSPGTALAMGLRNNDTTYLWMADIVGPCPTNAGQQVAYQIANTPDIGGAYVDVIGYYDRI